MVKPKPCFTFATSVAFAAFVASTSFIVNITTSKTSFMDYPSFHPFPRINHFILAFVNTFVVIEPWPSFVITVVTFDFGMPLLELIAEQLDQQLLEQQLEWNLLEKK